MNKRLNKRILICLLVLPTLTACDFSGRDDPSDASQEVDSAQSPAQTTDGQTATARTSVSVSATRPATSPATTQSAQPQDGGEAAHAKLYGTWVAQDVDASMGEVKVRVTFRKQGPVRILAWSDLPFVGQVRNKQAPYTINGNTISSDALRGGTSVKYHFDGETLVIEYKDGKTVRFTRQA